MNWTFLTTREVPDELWNPLWLFITPESTTAMPMPVPSRPV